MIFTPIPKEKIPHAWQTLQRLTKCPDAIYDRLLSGADLAIIASDGCDGALILEVSPDRICWVKYLGGKIDGGPKKRLSMMRDGMAWIERAARNAGCLEVQLCGRDWSSFLTDFELIQGDHPNLMRKVLSMKEAA